MNIKYLTKMCIPPKNILPLFLLLMMITASMQKTNGQNVNGSTGLLTIPSAEIQNDGKISISFNYLDNKYVKYAHGKRDIVNLAVNIAYVPFMEIVLRGTRQLDIPSGADHVMDRYLALRFRILKDESYLPSVTVGFQNPFSTDERAKHFTSTYFVVTKNFLNNETVNRLALTLGYGSKIIKSQDYNYIGLFGGVDIGLFNFVNLLLEHDAERFNGGIRVNAFDIVDLTFGMRGFDSPVGGISFNFQL